MTRASVGTPYPTFLALQATETDDCILWPLGRDQDGYGRLVLNGKSRGVHQLSCEMAHGPRPTPGLQTAHSCRNRHCFNPRHLRWATSKENARDRLRDDTQQRGERCKTSKLTEAEVWQIRFFSRGGIRQVALGAHFNVSQQTISHVVVGRSWGWLPGAGKS